MRGCQWHPDNRVSAPENSHTDPCWDTRDSEGLMTMSEEAQKARQALQESMDLREQGHSDD